MTGSLAIYKARIKCLIIGNVSFYKEFVKMLNLKPGQKVLDVGCGIGGSAFYMIKVTVIVNIEHNAFYCLSIAP